MKSYLPSDIHSKALRDTYYLVQKIISDGYERALKYASDKDTRRALKEHFNEAIRETIAYYVILCKEVCDD